MTLEEEVKLLREKVELLEKLREIETQTLPAPPIPYIVINPPTVKPWDPPYIVTC